VVVKSPVEPPVFGRVRLDDNSAAGSAPPSPPAAARGHLAELGRRGALAQGPAGGDDPLLLEQVLRDVEAAGCSVGGGGAVCVVSVPSSTARWGSGVWRVGDGWGCGTGRGLLRPL
jgi:hypothetical protein